MLDHYREAKERYEFQMGAVRGGLATALDILTDALALWASASTCSQRQTSFPAMDVRLSCSRSKTRKDSSSPQWNN